MNQKHLHSKNNSNERGYNSSLETKETTKTKK